MSRALAAHVTAPLSSGRAARSHRKVSWVIFCSGRLPGCLEIQYGHKQIGMERTATSSLVPFQPFQPGRNKLRHALSSRKPSNRPEQKITELTFEAGPRSARQASEQV